MAWRDPTYVSYTLSAQRQVHCQSMTRHSLSFIGVPHHLPPSNTGFPPTCKSSFRILVSCAQRLSQSLEITGRNTMLTHPSFDIPLRHSREKDPQLWKRIVRFYARAWSPGGPRLRAQPRTPQTVRSPLRIERKGCPWPYRGSGQRSLCGMFGEYCQWRSEFERQLSWRLTGSEMMAASLRSSAGMFAASSTVHYTGAANSENQQRLRHGCDFLPLMGRRKVWWDVKLDELARLMQSKPTIDLAGKQVRERDRYPWNHQEPLTTLTFLSKKYVKTVDYVLTWFCNQWLIFFLIILI